MSVSCDGSEVALQPKRLLLLLYLLLEGRETAVRRDHLLALFWPETDSERARNALRQALFALRTALGGDVIVARGSAELVVDLTGVRCDALALIDAAAAADHAAVDALFRTDFLAAVDAGESAELERWVEDTRLRIRRLAAMAIRALALRPDAPDAERVAHLERLLMLAPYDEQAAMTLVAAHLNAGRRADAVEAYRRFAGRLREDLEIEPSGAFVQLVGSAREGDGVALPELVERERAPGPVAMVPVPARRSRVAGVLAALTLLLGAWVAFGGTLESTLVDVQPFTAPSGSAEGARVAEYTSERVRGALADVPGFAVIGTADGPRGPRFRRRLPGTEVRGGLEPNGRGGWRAWATVTALESDMLLQRAEVDGMPSDSVAAVLADRVAAIVATRREMELQWGTTLHRPTVLRALELFLSAFQSVAAGDAEAGIAKFEAAWAADSAFVFAGIMAANNANAFGDTARANRLIREVERSRRALLPLEEHQLARVRAWARADVQAALNESRLLSRLEPTAPFLAAQHAEDAVLANRPREALEALARIRVPAQNSDDFVLSVRARAYHMIGDFQKELEAVDPIIARQPAASHLAAYRLAPLAAIGRVDSLDIVLAAAAARADGRDVGRLYRTVGLELLAHGYAVDGRRVLADGVAWVRRQSTTPPPTLPRQFSAAELLLDAGELAAADERITAIAALLPATASVPQRSQLLALQGLLAARQGRNREAQTVSDSLGRLGGVARLGTETFRRARIAAALGNGREAAILLEQAFQEGFLVTREIHIDPAFDGVRSDPDFRRVTAPRG